MIQIPHLSQGARALRDLGMVFDRLLAVMFFNNLEEVKMNQFNLSACDERGGKNWWGVIVSIKQYVK